MTKVKALLRQRRRWAEGSIQRYLDYIFPLNSPTRLSFVERLDTFAFTVYFIVPALIVLEVTSELICLSMGVPTYPKVVRAAHSGGLPYKLAEFLHRDQNLSPILPWGVVYS